MEEISGGTDHPELILVKVPHILKILYDSDLVEHVLNGHGILQHILCCLICYTV